MKLIFAVVIAFVGFVSQANAANCVSPLTGNDAGGTSRNFGVTLDASNNCYGNVALVDGTNAANKATVTAVGALKVDNSAVTQPISAASLPLPTGGATSALQTTGNTALTTINTTLGTPMQNSGGSVTANAGTNLNTSALATSANQTNATQKTQIVDGSGNVIASTSNNLDVQCANCSGSGVSTADEATFTAGTSLFAGTGGFFQTTVTSNPLTNGKQGMWQMTAYRAGMVNNRDSTGAENIGTTADSVCGSATGTCSLIALSKFQANAISSSIPAGTNLIGGVNTAQVNGVTVLTGTGATGTGAQRVTVSTDQATNAGAALAKGGVGVVNGGSFYEAVAASQTATALQSSAGAAGDYLSHCVIYPASTSPGVVTVFDSTNTAANSAILFAGGATSTSNLTPIAVPVGAISVNGAWKVTTGANVSVVCYGKFS